MDDLVTTRELKRSWDLLFLFLQSMEISPGERALLLEHEEELNELLEKAALVFPGDVKRAQAVWTRRMELFGKSDEELQDLGRQLLAGNGWKLPEAGHGSSEHRLILEILREREESADASTATAD
jgi:hypothetical protein